MKHGALWIRVLFVAVLVSLATGCSTVRAPSEADPFEGFNRSVDSFNQVVDKAVKPVAQVYDNTVPAEVKGCVSNFFSNLNDLSIAVNNLLQGKVKDAGSDLCRFAINSTIGVLGFADVATSMGFEKHDEDFGQTLGYWGVGSGPYLVLPFFGPSSIRDAVGRVVDNPLDLVAQHHPVDERNQALGLKAVNKRAALLPATDLVDRIALDQYSFVRDAYLARRASQVRDGSVANDERESDPESDVDLPAMEQAPAAQ